MKFKALMILILLLLCITVTGQTIVKKDSNTVSVDKQEFKYIINSFVDLQLYKTLDIKNNEKIGVLNRIIGDKDGIISQQQNNINLLKEQIESIKPKWYDNFLMGFGVASIVFAVIVSMF